MNYLKPCPKPKQSKRRKKVKNYKKKAITLAKYIITHHPDIPGCERCGKTYGQMHGSHIIPIGMGSANESVAGDLRNIQKLCATCHKLGNDSWHQHPCAGVEWLEDYAPGLYNWLREKNRYHLQFGLSIDWQMKYEELKIIKERLEI